MLFIGLLSKRKKCVFCNKSHNTLTKVTTMENFYNYDRHFHMICLRGVLCEPEAYGDRLADMAIEIFDEMRSKESTTKVLAEMRKARLRECCKEICGGKVDD